jgi:chitin disaccharide deacetylase
VTSLAERLGYRDTDRLVIVSCDDLGMCHALNEGVLSALDGAVATCASIMVPAPWARHAARRLSEPPVGATRPYDIGVHLTLNAEHELFRWGPITHAPSLVDGNGGFPAAIDDLWEHADVDEVRRECRAQIERATAWGIDVTHLAPHLSSMPLRPEFFDVYLDLALEFALPIRLPGQADVGFPARDLAAEEGLLFPDHFDRAAVAGSRDRAESILAALEPGVTELHIQPAIDTAEVRALSPLAAEWIDDLALANPGGQLDTWLHEAGAIRIGYRELRAAQRAHQ